MANLCDTTYIIKDKKVGETLNGIFKKLSGNGKKDIRVSEFLKKINYLEDGDYRGTIYFFNYDETPNVLTFGVESAWNKIDDIEIAINRKYGDDIEIIWESEEFGCDIFETNDSEGEFFEKDYYCFFDEDSEEEYLCGEKELIDSLNEYYGKHVCNNEKEAFEYVENNKDEDGYHIERLLKRKIVD